MKRYIILFAFLITGTILFQGFQCTSPELTTAKVALKNQDYPKARDYLKKVVEKEPNNGEAWVLLIETQQIYLKDNAGAAKSWEDGRNHITDPIQKQKMQQLRYTIWASLHDKAVDQISKATNTKNSLSDTQRNMYLDSAITNINTALTFNSEYEKLYYLKGYAYEIKKDTSNAMEAYKKFSELMEPNVQVGKEKKLYSGMLRNDILKIMKPIITTGVRFAPGQDSLLTDEILVSGRSLFVYYQDHQDRKGVFTVIGWRYNPPKDWLRNEKTSPEAFIFLPYKSMANIYFEHKDYDNAIKNILTIVSLEPSNQSANTFLVLLYDKKGNPDQALQSSAQYIKDYPEDKYARLQYGDMLFNLAKYDEAIVQYEYALKIDATFSSALRNLASTYKNKAVLIQKTQQDQSEKDINYKPVTDEYFPILRKSVQAFNECRKDSTYKDDIVVISELANIYEVLGDKDNLNKMLGELESRASKVPKDQLERYYLSLFKIYDRQKRTEDANRIKALYDALPK